MCETRHVFESRLPDPSVDPTWFPYSSKSYKWQLRLLRLLYSRGSVVRRLSRLF